MIQYFQQLLLQVVEVVVVGLHKYQVEMVDQVEVEVIFLQHRELQEQEIHHQLVLLKEIMVELEVVELKYQAEEVELEKQETQMVKDMVEMVRQIVFQEVQHFMQVVVEERVLLE
jgi:hypothetical protein